MDVPIVQPPCVTTIKSDFFYLFIMTLYEHFILKIRITSTVFIVTDEQKELNAD